MSDISRDNAGAGPPSADDSEVADTFENCVSRVRLDYGKANALNEHALDELFEAFGRLSRAKSAGAVVLSSTSKRFFSAGFDVGEVFAFERGKMGDFFAKFIRLYERLKALPHPLVVAVGGHAVAGGAVLALTGDFRVFARGDYYFSLNEVDLGAVLPMGVSRMAVAAVGPAHAKNLLLRGAKITPEQAERIGLAHMLVDPDDLESRAVELAKELAQKPPQAYAAIKADVDRVISRVTATDLSTLETFLDHWFSDEARACRETVRAKLRK